MFALNKRNLVVISILAALLILAAYQYQAVAFMSDGGTPFRQMGVIMAFDPAANIVTVQDVNNTEFSFNLNGNVDITKCYGAASLRDLEAGDMITLGYSDDSNGTRVVNWIDLEDVSC